MNHYKIPRLYQYKFCKTKKRKYLFNLPSYHEVCVFILNITVKLLYWLNFIFRVLIMAEGRTAFLGGAKEALSFFTTYVYTVINYCFGNSNKNKVMGGQDQSVALQFNSIFHYSFLEKLANSEFIDGLEKLQLNSVCTGWSDMCSKPRFVWYIYEWNCKISRYIDLFKVQV